MDRPMGYEGISSPIGFGSILRVSIPALLCLILAAFLYEKLAPARQDQDGSGQLPRRVFFARVHALIDCAAVGLVLTIISYACCFWWGHFHWFGHRLAAQFPYGSPYIPFQHLWDLRAYQARMPFLHSVDFFRPGLTIPWEYPGAIALLYVPLLASPFPILTFLLLIIPLLAFAGFTVARRLRAEGLATLPAYALMIGTMLFSYPLWLELELGNMEIFIFILVAAAVLCIIRQRTYVAAVLLGLATGMKIFPGVYFGLLLQRRQYKQIAVGLLTAVTADLLGLWILCPSIRTSYSEMQKGLDFNRSHYMLTWLPQETGMDHSGFGLLKKLTVHHYGVHMPPRMLSVYMLVVAVIGLSAYVLRIRKLPFVNQVAALCVSSILLPPTSHDYTLIHLYIPWAMLAVLAVRSARHGIEIPGLRLAMVCFGILFAAETEFIHQGNSFSGQIKCVVLMVLFVVMLLYPMTLTDQGTSTREMVASADLASA